MGIINNRMVVEIWSDIMCPFCYLGKRKFENALSQFSEKENVSVVWRSFQLNPDLKTDTILTIYDYLIRVKGFEPAKAKEVNDHVTQSGKQVGIDYHFDRVVVANTFRAHILLHFAQKQGMQDETKERLLRAYFTEGRNVDDIQTLLEIGGESGLNMNSFSQDLEDDTYVDEVREDIYDAQQFGIRGVPFFVFDRKYGVSGAQEPSVFSETLEKAFGEWRKNNSVIQLEVTQRESCDIDREC